MNEITPAIYDGFTPLPADEQGWHGDHALFGALIRKHRPRHIIEVGTWKGQSALTMARYVKSLGLKCLITCVDTWLGAEEFWGRYAHTPERDLMLRHGYPQIYYQFLSNVVHAGMQDVVLPMPLPSNLAAKLLRERGVLADLIYIDGSHEAEDVLADCNNYWPLLRSGGVLFGDDHSWPGLASAVAEFHQSHHGITSPIQVVDDFWIIQRP